LLRYMARRGLQTVPVIFMISVLVFGMLHLLPGDPVLALIGDAVVSAETIEQLRQAYGLNDPLPVQYWRFASKAVQGDFGRSIRTRVPVIESIVTMMPATIELALAGLGIAVVLGTILGVTAALRQNTWVDSVSMVVALVGVSMPNFWLGLVLIIVFAFNLRWFPSIGRGTPAHLVLPAIALGVRAAATIARLTRSSMLEVLRQEYILTARAKGLSERVVVYRHALKNALVPVVTVIGLQFGGMLGGAVVIETVFSRQGVGQLAVAAIQSHDFPLVQGTVLLSALMYLTVNLIVDGAYALIDPRIRYS